MKPNLETWTKSLGIYCASWSPGDGFTRYRFFEEPSNFFGPNNGIHTTAGRKEAVAFLNGFQRGRSFQERKKPCKAL